MCGFQVEPPSLPCYSWKALVKSRNPGVTRGKPSTKGVGLGFWPSSARYGSRLSSCILSLQNAALTPFLPSIQRVRSKVEVSVQGLWTQRRLHVWNGERGADRLAG